MKIIYCTLFTLIIFSCNGKPKELSVSKLDSQYIDSYENEYDEKNRLIKTQRTYKTTYSNNTTIDRYENTYFYNTSDSLIKVESYSLDIEEHQRKLSSETSYTDSTLMIVNFGAERTDTLRCIYKKHDASGRTLDYYRREIERGFSPKDINRLENRTTYEYRGDNSTLINKTDLITKNTSAKIEYTDKQITNDTILINTFDGEKNILYCNKEYYTNDVKVQVYNHFIELRTDSVFLKNNKEIRRVYIDEFGKTEENISYDNHGNIIKLEGKIYEIVK